MLFLVYRILWWVILPWVLLFRYLKDKKSGKAGRYCIERLGFSNAVQPHDVILHAVSLGEVRAMTPLVCELLKTSPSCSILITTTTLTGRAQIEKSFGDQVSVTFLPHDIGFFVRRFLKKVRPKALMIMETEIWPNLLSQCAKLGIETFIISACLSDRSQKGYQKMPKTIAKLLAPIHVMAQTKEDQARFLAIGAEKVTVMGNLKYFTILPEDFNYQVTQLTKGKHNYLLWCLASSHDGEEKLILEHFKTLKEQHPHLKLAIAPRHPERFKAVRNLIKDYGFLCQARSETAFEDFEFNHHDVWLFDTIGELLYLYGVSDIVTVGGSFVPIGGHNILEPACLKKVITTGPYVDNIMEMVTLFQAHDAIEILTHETLEDQMAKLIEERAVRRRMKNAAEACVQQNQHALPYVIDALKGALEER